MLHAFMFMIHANCGQSQEPTSIPLPEKFTVCNVLNTCLLVLVCLFH